MGMLKKALMGAPEARILSPATSIQLTCPSHGEYSGYRMETVDGVFDSICPECHEEERTRENVELMERIKLAQNQDIFNRSSIPPLYQRKGLHDYHPTCEAARTVKVTLEKYVSNADSIIQNGTSLLLLGGTGTGKTHCGCAVGMNYIHKGYTAIYSTAQDLIQFVQQSWAKGSEESQDDKISRFVGFDLLVLDELGRWPMTPAENKILWAVINRRAEQEKPTIGVSLLGLKKLEKTIGEDIVSRLQIGGGAVLQFTWDDYRISKKC